MILLSTVRCVWFGVYDVITNVYGMWLWGCVYAVCSDGDVL